jgi:acyl-CoA thioesterase
VSGAWPHDADLALIPFEIGAGGPAGSFTLTPDLCRFDGALYGGTGVAAAVMAMEAATQRDALWVLTQFVASPRVGARVDWEVRTLADGKRVSQVEVLASVDGELMLCSLGATAEPRPDGLEGQYVGMPSVSEPDDSPPLVHGPGTPELRGRGFHANLEFRQAVGDRGNGVALWARRGDGLPLTRAAIAYLADMVPMAVARAAGKLGAGFSLDNALRFATVPPTEWVLLDLRAEVAGGGYGHGSFTAFATDGTLVATGSQTATMIAMFDPGDEDAASRWQATIKARMA